MKKGRHRRFEEARALKRSTDFDAERLFESLQSEKGTGDGPAGLADDDRDDDEDLDEEDDD